jgi:hypothetical protein
VHLPAMTATKLLAMRSMRDFDPARPARVHDLLNDATLEWNTGWADNWRKYAHLTIDGAVYWGGLILDGWEPAARPQ